MSEKSQILTSNIPNHLAGKRLDAALANMFPDYSRARIQTWIKSGHVFVDNCKLRPRDIVTGGESVKIEIIPEIETHWMAQDIPLDIVYQDDSIIIVNKPPGLTVHPGAGNYDGTLSNALLYYDRELEKVPRSGIVHRLDKNTSGLMVIARNLTAQTQLVSQIQARTMKREYEALVVGNMTAGGTIDQPIGRHPKNRLRMAVVERGKPAVTHYRILNKFRAHTHVQVFLETGRTHQIRVHMSHIHYPIVGDQTYGGRLHIPPNCSVDLQYALQLFKRQALHATKLTLLHPVSQQTVSWHVPAPYDMLTLLEAVKNDTQKHII